MTGAPEGVPDNWVEVTGDRIDAPTVVFDLDGVLSDAAHRQKYLRQIPPDWANFNWSANDDPPIDSGLALLAAIDARYRVVIMTARPAELSQLTRDWLDAHDVRHDLLILRPHEDARPSPDMKRSQLHELEARGADVRLAIDDDIRNVEMYQAEGVASIYIHSGYYDDGVVA